MREDFKELYSKITDPRVFTRDKWYNVPKSVIQKEFIDWYGNTGCLEFSSTRAHFRVVAYPVSEIQSISESLSFGKKKEVKVTDVNVTVIPGKLEVKNSIPGWCSRMDLVNEIRKQHGLDEIEQEARKPIRKQVEIYDDDL